jgi:hypothetical protein
MKHLNHIFKLNGKRILIFSMFTISYFIFTSHSYSHRIRSQHNSEFVNSIVSGEKCNTFGYDKYVQNSDATAAYKVTIKLVAFKAGVGSKESQKVVDVDAGGKTYLGCSIGAGPGPYDYTYSVIGEAKK